ncbi:ABC transporter ATP-binding protein [Youngiibacter fragilis]|uniref:ABC transporter n=1 Tax=Youngiibacter fragilis 232.1 TaxID=994573 RepID=V7IAN5_9CLOT|nr:ABC transporter ATP-binding protein [Youngiibacter fragilis]ETA81917.1 ABC transporter [Youngiibacter fragilis 232.1]
MEKILEIRNLDKSFGGVHAINHLSFDVYKGEILGLIGPNGSGKSTSVNLISGVYLPDEGEIIYKGENIIGKSIPDRAYLGIGRTFQSPRPFEGLTVRDSIYTVALLHHRKKADAKTKTEEILEMSDLMPIANELCAKLPIEKRKWLDMARVLAMDPSIIMLDECLAGLNPQEMEMSTDFVQKINQMGITIIFIEHVMAAVTKICHRVVVLNEGGLLCDGDPNVVMKMPEVIEAYLGGGYKNAIEN